MRNFSFADYRHITALDKEIVRTRAGDLIADRFSRDTMIAKATDGTTGVPVWFWHDERDRAWGGAAAEWLFARVGYRAGDMLGVI